VIFYFRTVAIAPPGRSAPPVTPRPRPITPLRVFGRNGTMARVNVLIDTGADEVLLPTRLIAPLGFTPGAGQTRRTRGVGGRVAFQYFDVELELLAGTNNRVRWRTTVGFGPVPPQIGLFGVAGGLEFFQLSMNVIDGCFALSPHPLIGPLPPTAYPHTPYPIP